MKGRWLVMTIASIASLLIVPLFGAAQCVNSTGGHIVHSIRFYPVGNWQPFGDVTEVAGIPGVFGSVSIAGNSADGELHMVGATNDGRLWHTIRHADGSWDQFGDVTSQAGRPGTFFNVHASFIGNDLHVVGLTVGGGMWHTIRYASGQWQDFRSVFGQSRPPQSQFSSVSVAGDESTGELQVVGATTNHGLWHTIRYASGAWQPNFENVKGQAGDPGPVVWVGAAASNGALDVAVTTSSGRVYGTLRLSSGRWDSWSDITAKAGTPDVFAAIDIARDLNAGYLHVVTLGTDGVMWHTMGRGLNWQAFGNVDGQAGNPGPMAWDAASLIGSNLHVAGSIVCYYN